MAMAKTLLSDRGPWLTKTLVKSYIELRRFQTWRACLIMMSGEHHNDTCANLPVGRCYGFSGPTSPDRGKILSQMWMFLRYLVQTSRPSGGSGGHPDLGIV